ncbi:restriction endonuclease subunit S [Lonepinella sp. BR2357]|uniref:restriction endonuclease subunit S n=1 Tax=Lonepinella sp. BR2357 TaxID=3434549 RepID=UPI003F6DBFE4
MSDWNIVELSECADFQEGYVNPTQTEPSYFGGDIKWVRATDLNNWSVFNTSQTLTKKGFLSAKKSALLFEPNTIVISKSGTIGRLGILKDYMCGNRAIINIKVNDRFDNLFIFYSLLNNRQHIEALAEGSVQKNLYISSLKKLKIDVPSLDTQGKIGSILQVFDDKITLNTQTNQTLEQIAQTIFKSWFIDFDPVRAKAEALADGKSEQEANLAAAEVIGGESAVEMARVFPSGFGEDGVPLGWGVKPLKDFGAIICGKTPSKSKTEYYGNDIPFIKIPDMHNNVFITKTVDNLSKTGGDSQVKKYIPKGSICVSCIATVGLVAIASELSQTNQQINSIVPNEQYFSEFLYFSLSQEKMKKYLIALASSGSATPNMNTSTFSNIEIINPPKELIKIFHHYVVNLFNKILSNNYENHRLSELRDYLLPKLLSGEIEL